MQCSKEVRILRKEDFIINSFEKDATKIAKISVFEQVINSIPKVWFEFQSSASDYGHLDGIFSRTSLFNVNKKDYDTIIWVAKSFDGKQEGNCETLSL